MITTKVDELLKRLENIKIDENKIDERHEIAEYIAQKLGVDNSIHYYHYIVTKDKKIYDTSSYKELLKSNGISPNDAYVYVKNDYSVGYDLVSYLYPFLIDRYLLPDAYLSKLGLESKFYRIAPATGLRYVSMVVRFLNAKHAVVEVANIDNVAINTNLPRIVHDIINDKLPSLEGGKNLNISSENAKTELPAGQLLGHEEREPISPAIPAVEDQSSTRKRGVTPKTSENPRPLGRGGGQINTKQIDDDVAEIIASQLVSQKLFAGHEYYEALVILYKYYENRDTSLTKEVEAIRDAYNHIFKPYRVVYDLNTKQFISI